LARPARAAICCAPEEVSMAEKEKRPEAPAPAPAPMPEAQMGPERRPVTGTAPATALKAGQQPEKKPAAYGKG
jgi:hypothetical protein